MITKERKTEEIVKLFEEKILKIAWAFEIMKEEEMKEIVRTLKRVAKSREEISLLVDWLQNSESRQLLNEEFSIRNEEQMRMKLIDQNKTRDF